MSPAGSLGLRRTSGALLVTSLIIVLVAAAVMVVSGALPAFFDFLGGSLESLEPHLQAFRFSTYLWALAWVTLLLGFVALTRLLIRYGDEQFAVLSLAPTAIATILGILEAAFSVGVTTWAVEEAARTGATPEIYTVLKDGLLDKIQFAYTILGFAAQAGFGAALLKTRLIPSWAGMTAVVWGLVWLVLDSFFLGIPALLLFMPAVIGVALLTTGGTTVRAQAKMKGEAIHG